MTTPVEQVLRRPRSAIDDRWLFLQQFLRHPREIASITPSSRFLERHIVELASIPSARAVVELGAGTGGTTRAMLDALPSHATLLTIDVNDWFCELVRRLGDPRLFVHCGNAQGMREATLRHGLAPPDVVVSGIPFSTIDRAVGSAIVETIASMLRPGGRFVAYQVSSAVDEVSRPWLGPPHVEVELLNIPPLRLYRWQKR